MTLLSALCREFRERDSRSSISLRGDVHHMATWIDGTWVHESRQQLVTTDGSANYTDDVQFTDSTAEHEFEIAVLDNCGRGEIPPGHNTSGDGRHLILRFVP